MPSTPTIPVVAATSTPPPINWATKPRVQPEPVTTNGQLELPPVELANSLSTRRLIPIFIDPEHIGELQQAIHLSTRRLIPIFIDPKHIGELQAILRLSPANDQAVPSVPSFGHHKEKGIESSRSQQPVADHEEISNPNGETLPIYDESLDSAISSLATLTVSSPPSSSPQVLSSNSASLSRKRYYVITVGKCAGIFYNEWLFQFYF